MPCRTAAAIALLVVLGFAPASAAADAFYTNLMSEAVLAHDRGDFREAARRLRIACFGLLEEPALLAECSVRLALARAASGDRGGFDQAFQRLAELDRRFGAYGTADLDPETRAAFEERVVAWVPPAAIAGLSGFAKLERRQTVARLAALPSDQRRIQLLALNAADPSETAWIRSLAKLDVSERNSAMGAEWARQLLELEPGDPEGICLRGRAAAQAAKCPQAVADLASCVEGPTSIREIEEQVGCFIALGRMDEAATRLLAAPVELQQQRPIRRLAKRIEEARGELLDARAATEVGDDPAATEPIDPASIDARQAVPPETLEELRQRITTSRELETLRPLATEVAALADASPVQLEVQRLAGEAAYRIADWSEAVRFLDRSGLDPTTQPALVFYLAVSRYETGDLEGAARALVSVLPLLRRTPLVDRYAERILESS